VVQPKDALAEVHLSIGSDIDLWRDKPAAREIAYYDPRSPAQRARSQRLHAEVVAELRARGLTQLVPDIDGNIYAAIADPKMPADIGAKVFQLALLDLPEAVFIAPAH